MLKPRRDSSSDLDQARRLSQSLAGTAPPREEPAQAAGYVDLSGLATPPARTTPAARAENVAASMGTDVAPSIAPTPEPPAPSLDTPAPMPEVAAPAPLTAEAPSALQPEPAVATPTELPGPEPQPEPMPTEMSTPNSTPNPAPMSMDDDEDPFADLDVFDLPEPEARTNEPGADSSPTLSQAETTAPDHGTEAASIATASEPIQEAPPVAAPEPVAVEAPTATVPEAASAAPEAQADGDAKPTGGFGFGGADDDDLDELFDGILGDDADA